MPTARRTTVPAPPTEAQFQRQIIDALRLTGWYVYHTRYSIGSDPGYPDLTAWRPESIGRRGMTIWIEVKGPRGSLSIQQGSVIATLRDAGNRAYVWKSGEITIEEIMEILR